MDKNEKVDPVVGVEMTPVRSGVLQLHTLMRVTKVWGSMEYRIKGDKVSGGVTLEPRAGEEISVAIPHHPSIVNDEKLPEGVLTINEFEDMIRQSIRINLIVADETTTFYKQQSANQSNNF